MIESAEELNQYIESLGNSPGGSFKDLKVPQYETCAGRS